LRPLELGASDGIAGIELRRLLPGTHREPQVHVAEVFVGERVGRQRPDRFVEGGPRLIELAAGCVHRSEIVVRLGQFGEILREPAKHLDGGVATALFAEDHAFQEAQTRIGRRGFERDIERGERVVGAALAVQPAGLLERGVRTAGIGQRGSRLQRPAGDHPRAGTAHGRRLRERLLESRRPGKHQTDDPSRGGRAAKARCYTRSHPSILATRSHALLATRRRTLLALPVPVSSEPRAGASSGRSDPMLRIYNTLTRSKEEFVPLDPGKVRMYVCGMTVYDWCHVGHARVLVVFDTVQRWLRASGYRVTYVRNVTDIDDKIIKRAVENGETLQVLTERFIGYMHEDADALGVQRPDHEPRATQYVPQMLGLIDLLEKNALAYRADDGDVNFSVRRFDRYGRLSGKSLDDLRAGERVAVADAKQDPLDFVLWKAAKDEDPDEARWSSRYGTGRPGWHIECSAMATSLLGKTIDIHGGGADLQFPHHENEIAQSEGALGCQFVRYWMHNGFVRIDDEKMSKSLGNFFTIREVLAKFDAEVVRMFMLRAHYRSPLNYSDAHLEDARLALLRLYNALEHAPAAVATGSSTAVGSSAAAAPAASDSEAPIDWSLPAAARFREAMDDDFNTPVALSVLFELASEANRGSAVAAQTLRRLAALLGLLGQDPASVRQRGLHGREAAGPAVEFDDAAIEAMIAERLAAKKARDWATADRVREDLHARGIVLEDSASGTTWRRA
jgi:cysteinyl-tRNA synthetase